MAASSPAAEESWSSRSAYCPVVPAAFLSKTEALILARPLELPLMVAPAAWAVSPAATS